MADIANHESFSGVYGMPPVIQGGTMTYGDPSDGGTSMSLYNPAQYDPSRLNPYAAPYLNNLNNLYGMFSSSAAGGAFNPGFYNQLEGTDQSKLMSSLGNQYGAMGLTGSSAEAGAMSQALTNNQMAWMNRQQGDQMRSLQGLEGLDKMAYGMTSGIQGQYGDFESSYNQSLANLLGVQQQSNASNNSLFGQLGGGLIQGLAMGAAMI